MIWKSTAAAAVTVVSIYLVGAFIEADFNSAHWPLLDRATAGFFMIFAGPLAALASVAKEIAA